MSSLLETSCLLNPLILLVFTLAAHGLILFNDGLYWDAWMIDSWQRRKDWSTMKKFFSEVGMPLQHYLHKFIAGFSNRSIVYRLLVVASTYASALAIYLIATRFGFLDENLALVLSLLYLAYTGYHMNVDSIVILQYVLPTAMFYWAAYVAFVALDNAGATHWGLRLTSLVLFWCSFSANSLLVYYFGFLGLMLFLKPGFTEDVWRNAYFGFLEHLDYAVLPVVFWILKEKLAPRHGYYKDYNRIQFEPLRLVGSFINSIRCGVESAITAPIRSAIEKHFLWIPVGALVLAFYVQSSLVSFPLAISRPVAINLVVAGAVLCALAALPYILVGRNFSPEGWNTKHHLLFHLPVSLMILGAASLLLPAKVVLPVLVSMLAVNMVHLNLVYLYYIAVAAKDRSWLYKLSRIEGANQTSVFYITDKHSIQGDDHFPQNSPAYSFYMFEWLWADKTRIGIHVSASHRQRLQGEQISKLLAAATLEYDMQEVNIRGSHARLVISDGTKRTPIWIALMYLKERYLPGGKVERVLEEITDLNYAQV